MKKRPETEVSDTIEYLEVPDEDRNLYFSGTFLKVFVGEEETPNWMQIKEFGDSRVSGSHPVLGTQAYDVDSLRFDFSFPEVGMYNYKKSVVHFSRTSNRQNKKGLCQNTGAIFSVDALFHNRYMQLPDSFRIRQIWQWRLTNVMSLFGNTHPAFPEYSDVYGQIAKCRAFARILSRNFYIAPGIDTNSPSLWYRRSFVGDCVGKREILVRNPAFFEETKDEFLSKGVSIDAAF